MIDLAMRAIFLPAVNAAPMQHHGRFRDTGWALQIADQLFVAERQLDNLERRIEIFSRLAEHAQRVLICLKLFRRIGRRITADTAGVERLHVKFGKLLAGCSSFSACVRLLLIAVPDLAPFPCPAILVEIGERVHHSLGILAANLLERIETPGTHEFGLDLRERSRELAGFAEDACTFIVAPWISRDGGWSAILSGSSSASTRINASREEHAGTTSDLWNWRPVWRRCAHTALCICGSYPAKPIRLFVGFCRCQVDIIAQLTGRALGDRIGQTVVVENKPGAGGNSEPGAYQFAAGRLHYSSGGGRNTINATLFASLPYDFAPDIVDRAGQSHTVAAGGSSFPARTPPSSGLRQS